MCVCVFVCRFFCFVSSSVWCIVYMHINTINYDGDDNLTHYIIYVLLVTVCIFSGPSNSHFESKNLARSLWVRCVEQFVEHHFGEPKKKKKKWGETTIKFQMRKRKAITATVWNVHESTQSDWPRAWIIISIICLPFLRGSCNHERVCTKVPISFLLHFLLLIKVKQKYYISLKFNWNNNWISCRTFCCCCCCL